MPVRGLLASSLLLLLAGLLLCDSRHASAQGKTYVIKGMGTHYTRRGKDIRRQQPHKAVPLVQLKTGPGFVVANEERAWGTPLAVGQLKRIMAAYEKEFPKSPEIVGDLSKKGGGVLDNHNSHVDGRDVDLHLPLNAVEDVTDRTPRTVHAGRAWFIARALAQSCSVEYVFVDRQVQKLIYEHAREEGVADKELELLLQYPRSEKKAVGVVRHWTNHHDHFHARFQRPGAAPLPAVKAYCDWKKTRIVD